MPPQAVSQALEFIYTGRLNKRAGLHLASLDQVSQVLSSPTEDSFLQFPIYQTVRWPNCWSCRSWKSTWTTWGTRRSSSTLISQLRLDGKPLQTTVAWNSFIDRWLRQLADSWKMSSFANDSSLILRFVWADRSLWRAQISHQISQSNSPSWFPKYFFLFFGNGFPPVCSWRRGGSRSQAFAHGSLWHDAGVWYHVQFANLPESCIETTNFRRCFLTVSSKAPPGVFASLESHVPLSPAFFTFFTQVQNSLHISYVQLYSLMWRWMESHLWWMMINCG